MNAGVPCDAEVDHTEADNTPGMYLLDTDDMSSCNCMCLGDGRVVLSSPDHDDSYDKLDGHETCSSEEASDAGLPVYAEDIQIKGASFSRHQDALC